MSCFFISSGLKFDLREYSTSFDLTFGLEAGGEEGGAVHRDEGGAPAIPHQIRQQTLLLHQVE